MKTDGLVARRSLLVGATIGALGVIGPPAFGFADTPARVPLWRVAQRHGLVYGSSTSTWQLTDSEYRDLYAREAGILFTEDDLLWYRLRPSPHSGLDFTRGDAIVAFAERHDLPVFGAHLVWDQGFGKGWTHHDLWGLGQAAARSLLFGTVGAVVGRYKGRVGQWSVVNEAITNGDDGGVAGLRSDVPWYQTIGASYVGEAFHVAHEHDPAAHLVLNDFGYETVDAQGHQPGAKQQATLEVLDALLREGVPVHALGVQAHLLADRFAERFDSTAYRAFLAQVADRGLSILVTELDVLDDGLPADPGIRDPLVADVYRRYLDTVLDEPAVGTVMTFGLSDRYTWLQEDDPRADGAPRRPLPFDRRLRPVPAYDALRDCLARAKRPNATPSGVE